MLGAVSVPNKGQECSALDLHRDHTQPAYNGGNLSSLAVDWQAVQSVRSLHVNFAAFCVYVCLACALLVCSCACRQNPGQTDPGAISQANDWLCNLHNEPDSWCVRPSACNLHNEPDSWCVRSDSLPHASFSTSSPPTAAYSLLGGRVGVTNRTLSLSQATTYVCVAVKKVLPARTALSAPQRTRTRMAVRAMRIHRTAPCVLPCSCQRKTRVLLRLTCTRFLSFLCRELAWELLQPEGSVAHSFAFVVLLPRVCNRLERTQACHHVPWATGYKESPHQTTTPAGVCCQCDTQHIYPGPRALAWAAHTHAYTPGRRVFQLTYLARVPCCSNIHFFFPCLRLRSRAEEVHFFAVDLLRTKLCTAWDQLGYEQQALFRNQLFQLTVRVPSRTTCAQSVHRKLNHVLSRTCVYAACLIIRPPARSIPLAHMLCTPCTPLYMLCTPFTPLYMHTRVPSLCKLGAMRVHAYPNKRKSAKKYANRKLNHSHATCCITRACTPQNAYTRPNIVAPSWCGTRCLHAFLSMPSKPSQTCGKASLTTVSSTSTSSSVALPLSAHPHPLYCRWPSCFVHTHTHCVPSACTPVSFTVFALTHAYDVFVLLVSGPPGPAVTRGQGAREEVEERWEGVAYRYASLSSKADMSYSSRASAVHATGCLARAASRHMHIDLNFAVCVLNRRALSGQRRHKCCCSTCFRLPSKNTVCEFCRHSSAGPSPPSS